MPAEERRWSRGILACVAAVPAVFILRSPIEGLYKSIFPLQEVGGVLARQFGQVQPGVIAQFYEFVVDTMVMDIIIGLGIVAAGLAALHYYRLGRLSLNAFTIVLVLAVVADLWRIAYRPMDAQPRQDKELIFSAPDYVAALQRDSTEFRTLTFRNGQPPYDNTLAYWRIESAYGYQGAKMRAYQDMVDVAGLGNPLVWQLMNVKYIISNTPDSSAFLRNVFNGQTYGLFEFTEAKPRAFFVDALEHATPLEILQNIRDMRFTPEAVAYTSDEVPSGIEPPGEGASVEILHHGIQDLEARIVATGRNLVFFSETWYPEGWKAILDGEDTNILRINYLFRGVVVPPGEHTLRMVFEPESFAIGKTLSLVANILLLGGFGVVIVSVYRKRKDRAAERPE